MFIHWESLTNPVYVRRGWSTKDACVIDHAGLFHIFSSAFFFARGQERTHLLGVTTPDWVHYSEPTILWDGEGGGWTGMCSPNISQVGERFYLTYNSWGETHPNGETNQLLYAVSDDLVRWEKDNRLAPDLTRGIRAIDAAVAHHNGRWHLVYKERQRPIMAWADGLDGPWHKLGEPSGGWFENAQFLAIGGVWHLLCTRRDHEPWLRRLEGNPDEPEGWLQWGDPQKLDVPQEAFNRDEKANAAFLADWREHDGHFYLLYAGRSERWSHAGRGDNRLALARSQDLVTWAVPGALG